MIPPRNSNWIIWWLILVPTAVVIGKHMFEPTITLGEIIGLTIGVPAFIFGVWKVINYLLYIWHPFKLWYQEELQWKSKQRPLMKTKKIPMGTSEFLLRIQPKRPTLFNKVHLRFVDKKNVNARSPNKNDIQVADIWAHAEGLIGDVTNKMDDFTNGMQGNLSDYHCAPEESLFLKVKVVANKKWSGYIMFHSHRSDEHRGYAYLPVEVMNK